MDDNDAKNTGGKYRMIPIFEKAVTDRDEGHEDHGRERRRRLDLTHGTQALDFVLSSAACPRRARSRAARSTSRGDGVERSIGSIDKGKYADIVAVSWRPARDITDPAGEVRDEGWRDFRDDLNPGFVGSRHQQVRSSARPGRCVHVRRPRRLHE